MRKADKAKEKEAKGSEAKEVKEVKKVKEAKKAKEAKEVKDEGKAEEGEAADLTPRKKKEAEKKENTGLSGGCVCVSRSYPCGPQPPERVVWHPLYQKKQIAQLLVPTLAINKKTATILKWTLSSLKNSI